jgi:N-acetylglucosamine-6-phosphate deacetylase
MAGRSLLTLAPEQIDGAVLKRLAAAGLRIAIGHSDASAAEVAAAADDGATGVTHLFNAMSQMMPRAPGVVGATLADERLFAGIICDGLHVDPVNLRAAFRAQGRDRLMLVTDAMSLVGSDKASFLLHGRTITLKDGRLTDAQGTLAGAHIGMIEAVRNAVRLMGVTIEDALIMASRTPARFLGLDKELGRILPGYRADLVAFDAARVLATWIGGRP